jgi:hypothetical protein
MKATYYMTLAGHSKFEEEDKIAVEWSMGHDFLIMENDYGKTTLALMNFLYSITMCY